VTNQTRYSTLIQQAASLYGLNADLLEAQVLEESSGEPDAFRWEPDFYRHCIHGRAQAVAGRFGPLAACSYGLLQIMLETAMERGFADRPEQLFVDRVGLAWGAKHLQALLALSPGDYPLALARYNGGAAVARPFASPQLAYVTAIYKIAGQSVPPADGIGTQGTVNA
jgi:soluble lytic murein transglycosylase-like protein